MTPAAQAAAWALTCSAACLFMIFGIATQVKLWPHLSLSVSAAKAAAPTAACIAAMAAWLLGGALLLLPVSCVGALAIYMGSEGLLHLSDQLQQLAQRESGVELALAGTVCTLFVANFPTAVFLLLSYYNGELIPSVKHQGQARYFGNIGRAAPFCVWRESRWMRAYRICLGIHLAWTITLFSHMRLMLVLDFIVSWDCSQDKHSSKGPEYLRRYFGPGGSQHCPRPHRFSSLRHGLRRRVPRGER